MSIHRLIAIQKLPVSLDTAWKYFANPHNLLSITPSSLNLKMTSKVYGDEVYQNQIMTYTVKPLFGISVGWVTEITLVDRMKMFIDDQREGPYKLWHHQHHFNEIEGGVEITDLVHYQLPFGLLGKISHGIIVKPKLRSIFNYRFQKINQLFGKWPGEELNFQID